MIRRLLAFILLCGGLAFAQTTTTNLHLNIPATGTASWGSLLNSNFSLLDGKLACFGTASSAGTIVYYNGTSWLCLGGNATGTKVLQETSSGVPSWATPSGGLADPGSNGLLTRTALNTTSIAANADVIALWTGTCSSTTYLRGDGSCTAPSGSGDASTNTATSVDSEIALFSSTTGKLLKRATLTGMFKGTSGVLSVATPGTDYVVPAGNVATATALAANGSNCSAGQAAAGVDASGVSEGCFAPSGFGSVDASAYSGTHWTDKVVAAYTALGAGGGRIIVPDSIADNGAATTPAIPSNVTLEFPGSSAAFLFCNMTTGKYTKIYMRGATLKESGSGCRGIEHLGVTASMQEIDHYLLSGVKIDCNSQTDSVGIYTQPSGNSAQDEYDNVAVTGCSNTGIWFSGQFAQFHQVMSWGNYVNLKMYKAGSDSNTFYDFKASVPGSGVNVIIWNGAEGGPGQGQGATYFINPTLLNGTVTAMAVIADHSLSVGGTDVRIIGGSPELGGAGATSVTIDGLTIKRAGFLYVDHAWVSYTGLDEADGSASPASLLENGATLQLEDAKGYGATGNTLVACDATSTVIMAGRHGAQGNVNCVSAYPAYVTGQYAWLSGEPILQYSSVVPNSAVGNPVTPSNSASGVTSSGTAVDATYGTVLQIVFSTAAGNRTTNHSWMGASAITTTGTSSDALGTVLAKSVGVNSIIRCGVAHTDNFAYSTTPLLADTWTRIVVFNGSLASGTAVLMNCFQSDGTGATVQFTGLQVSVQPTATSASSWVMSQILTAGAVGSNGYGTDSPCVAAGTAANPSVVSCSGARSGIVYCDVAASAGKCQVNTTAVSTSSRIQITPSGATTDGTLLGKTCNTSTTSGNVPILDAKANGASFTINVPTVTTNGACYEWTIVK